MKKHLLILSAMFSWGVGGHTDDAVFVSHVVPDKMLAGQDYPISITVKNTGSAPWTFAGKYKLGSQNPQDNGLWGFGRVNLAANDSISGGAEKTFAFTVRAPTTPGVYPFQWRMVQEAVHWFGAYSPNVSIDVSVDTIRPTVDLTAPSSNTTFTSPQTVSVVANASDNFAVTKVCFFMNDVFVATDTVAPYVSHWSITGADNGVNPWVAQAYDQSGNTATSPPLPVTVNIDVTPPTVALVSPTAHGRFVTPQTVLLAATANDNVAVSKVEFLLDGNVISTDPIAPFNGTWPITSAHNGLHTWAARAYDKAGNTTTSPETSIDVRSDDAVFVSHVVADKMLAGRDYPISITVRNTGSVPWTFADNYKLGSQNPPGNTRWGVGRVNLAANDSISG